MNDLISRDKAIADVLGTSIEYQLIYGKKEPKDGFVRSLIKKLANIPPEKPAWIPVAERLPQYGNYLVSFRTDEEIDIGTYDPKTGLWTACDADGMYYVASKGLEVIAWAPLPKPYQENKNGKE